MCFNATIMTPLDVAQKEYNLRISNDFSYNGYGEYKVAFTHPFLPIVLENRVVETAKWGLIPGWVRECKKAEEIAKYTLNARIETLPEKPSFKGSINKGRILVLFDGFFEWQHINGQKIPYYIHDENFKPLIAGGLVSSWGGINTFTLITTEAMGIMREIHNTKLRMPFFIHPDKIDYWLDSSRSFSDMYELKPNYSNLTAEKKSPV